MPYQILVNKNVIHIALLGRVTGGDLQAAADETVRHESAGVIPHRVTDMSGITELGIGFPDVFALAERRRSQNFPNSFKSAIIAPQAEHVGYARMFQTLNDNPHITIRIFPDEHTANEWIASPVNSAGGGGSQMF